MRSSFRTDIRLVTDGSINGSVAGAPPQLSRSFPISNVNLQTCPEVWSALTNKVGIVDAD